MSANGIGKPNKAMEIGNKERSMKVAWDLETYVAVDRSSMKYKRGPIGLSMLQWWIVMLRKRREQRTNGKQTILAVIPPWVERISIFTRLFLCEEWISVVMFSAKVTSALTCPCVDSSLRLLRVSSVSPEVSGGRRKRGMKRDGSMIKVSLRELCVRVIET